MNFEWDSIKNKANLEKHGIDFMLVKPVFDDENRIILVDDRKDYGEIRYQIIGMAFGHLLFVAYTQRDGKIRLISARFANKKEKRIYDGNN